MKNPFLRGICYVSMVFLAVALGLIILANYKLHSGVEIIDALTSPEVTEPAGSSAQPMTSPTEEPQQTERPSEPENAQNVTIAFAGDIVCHSGLNSEALVGADYDYTKIFGGASGYLQAADYAVCTLETTLPETAEYTGYPTFKSPAALAAGLKNIGIDLVSTATNHCMDAYQAGLKQTLDVLDKNELAHVGTYRSPAERNENSGVYTADINGVSAAFLSYTYGTEDFSIDSFDYAVNVFYTDYLTDKTTIDYDLIKSDMAAARELDTDIIVVIMHWGNEYYSSPIADQYELADLLFAEGADVIVGGHSHIPQPIEVREVVCEDGSAKTGYICYSLGNFVSCQNDDLTYLTAVLNVTVTKDLDTGDTYVSDMNYVPMFMVDTDDYDIEGAEWRYRLWDLRSAITSYENGDNLGVINEKMYEALKKGLEDIHAQLGFDYDITEVWANG